MSSENINLTNDDINSEIRNDNERSINFFQGTEVTILHKNISEPVDEDEKKNIEGLETLIKSFSCSVERLEFNKMLIGKESSDTSLPKKRSIIGKIIDEVIRFLKEVGQWIYSLLTNRIARSANKVRFLDHKRKAYGVKTIPVKYLMSIDQLILPHVVSESPTWVIDAGEIGLNFYKKTIDAHKKLIEYITVRPGSLDELKRQKTEVLEGIGRIISGGKVSSNGFITDILPGNKLFNITTKISDQNMPPFYFTDSSGFVKLKAGSWTPTPSTIDSGLALLEKFIKEIKKEQSNTTTLNRNFERNINAAKKDANSWTVAYYNWLIEINRKLISLTFQHVMRWFDALEGFVSSGIKSS